MLINLEKMEVLPSVQKGEPTGYDVLKDLIAFAKDCVCEIWPDIINIHTDNPVGMQNMIQLILANKPAKVTVMKFKHHRR
jgi:hypothetical protein